MVDLIKKVLLKTGFGNIKHEIFFSALKLTWS